MNETGLPVQVRQFIIRHITSVEQLELLILLANNPDKAWTIQQLVDEIRSSQWSVSERVKQLAEGGFLVNEGPVFRFLPSSPEKVAVVPDLAKAYNEYRVRVIELIYSGAGALEKFSEAFKLKPKE